MRFYAVEIGTQDLEEVDKQFVLRTRPDAAGGSESLDEQIAGARFIHWCEAAHLGDMFSNAAVDRLLAYLYDRTNRPGA